MDCMDDEWIGRLTCGYWVGPGWRVVKRCRDDNVCEAYVIPFLFGSFFSLPSLYIDDILMFFMCLVSAFVWEVMF